MDRKILGGTGTCRENSLWEEASDEGPQRNRGDAAAVSGSRPPASPGRTREPGQHRACALVPPEAGDGPPPVPFPPRPHPSVTQRSRFCDPTVNEKRSDSATASRSVAGWGAGGRELLCGARFGLARRGGAGWFVQPVHAAAPHAQRRLRRRTGEPYVKTTPVLSVLIPATAAQPPDRGGGSRSTGVGGSG